jgi:hypothetical protein
VGHLETVVMEEIQLEQAVVVVVVPEVGKTA